jgi:hypothetical protein
LQQRLAEVNRAMTDELGRDPGRPERGAARDIWEARQISDNAKSFTAALAEQGISIAKTTKEEARESVENYEYFEKEGR